MSRESHAITSLASEEAHWHGYGSGQAHRKLSTPINRFSGMERTHSVHAYTETVRVISCITGLLHNNFHESASCMQYNPPTSTSWRDTSDIRFHACLLRDNADRQYNKRLQQKSKSTAWLESSAEWCTWQHKVFERKTTVWITLHDAVHLWNSVIHSRISGACPGSRN